MATPSGRRLTFRTTDNTVTFTARPQRGMPQGAPESPMVYAALMEDRIAAATEDLARHRRPGGIRMDEDLTVDDVERSKLRLQDFELGDVVFVNFADDTYVIGASVTAVSYAVSVLQEALLPAGQVLHPGKCEFIDNSAVPDAQPAFVWSVAALAAYCRTGEVPRPTDATEVMKQVTSMVVLGTTVSIAAADAVSQRIAKGWQACSALRPQMLLRGVQIRDRLALLDAVLVPTVL